MIRKLSIWLDDERNPYTRTWQSVATNSMVFKDEGPLVVWLKSYDEFVNWLTLAKEDKYLFPTLVCFDHDLGNDKSGMDCAKYLVDFCMDNNFELPRYSCHSSNPAGRENILSYLNSYKKSIEK